MDRCEHCRFFQANPTAAVPGTITISIDGVRGGGECRRRPPLARTPDNSGISKLAHFPLVACDDWCGEFESQEC